MAEAAERRAAIVAALLTDWGHTDGDPQWTRTAERVAAVVDNLLPLDTAANELDALVTALRTKSKDNEERARMSQAAIDRIAEVRDVAVKAVWATRHGNATASDLARHLHLPPGLVNTIIHTERR